jgi:hypothetical protein
MRCGASNGCRTGVSFMSSAKPTEREKPAITGRGTPRRNPGNLLASAKTVDTQ